MGAATAREMLLLADGAPAIWRMLTGLYPDAFQLLDWYHLMEHLGAVANLHPDGTSWLAAQQEALRFRGPRETLLALKALHQRGETPVVQQEAGACLKYMWRHRQRLNYPEARRWGYPIGSGRIESAVKQVVQARAKQAGMRWNPMHLQQVLTARCAALNGYWACACAQTKAAVTRVASPSPIRLDPPQTSGKAMPSRRPSASTREEPRSILLKQMGQRVK